MIIRVHTVVLTLQGKLVDAGAGENEPLVKSEIVTFMLLMMKLYSSMQVQLTKADRTVETTKS